MKNSKDIIDKRRDTIMGIIQAEKHISVNSLAERLACSKLTIRRDLQYWESIGAITRNYGGANLIQNYVNNTENYENSRNLNSIAKRAASYVKDNDVIFINTSMTALLVLKYIKHKKVTIITNNAKAISYSPDPLITVIFTGGEVKYPKHSMTGNYTISMLKSITATKCFLGCSGIDEKGIYTSVMNETLINQTMIERTNGNRFILCSSKKFGLVYSFQYASFDAIDYVITDTKDHGDLSSEIISTIMSYDNIHLDLVDPIPFKDVFEFDEAK